MIDRRMIYVRELAMLNSQNRETYTAFLFALMMSVLGAGWGSRGEPLDESPL